MTTTLVFAEDTIPAKRKTKNKPWFWEIGYGKSVITKHHSLTDYKIAYGKTYREHHQFSISTLVSVNPDFFNVPDEVFFARYNQFSYGYRIRINKNVFYTPTIGIAKMKYAITTFHKAFESPDLINDLFNIEIKDKYETEVFEEYAVPVSLRFLFTTKRAGFSIDPHFIISRYPQTGITVSLILGRNY